MSTALVVLPFCSNGSVVGFLIGIVMSVVVVVVVVIAHPCRLLLRRRHHYGWEMGRASGRTISSGLGKGEGQY